ncbi:MAG: ATP12 family chaperone protein [Alphaproteobacteria bacterium]
MPDAPDRSAPEPHADTGRAELAAKAAQRAAERPVVRADADGFRLELGGKPLKTPAGFDLRLPTRGLAEAIAAELGDAPVQALKNFAAIPNLRFAATAIDRVAQAREATVESVAAYGEADLLCYRAERPAELVAREQAAWQPLLDWAAMRYGALLICGHGISYVPQQPVALAALRKAVAAQDDMALTGLAIAVQITGSLVLGLALLDGRIDSDEAFKLAELDASYQIEKWGEDAEAAAQRAARRKDLAEAAAYLRLLRPDAV